MMVFAEREFYRPDGGVRWGRVPGLLAICAGASFFTALFLALSLQMGWYLVVMSVAFSLLIAMIAVHFAVSWAQLRNPWLATILGALTGFTGYFGMFQLEMASSFGPQLLHRVDLLPSFVRFRMSSDIQHEVGRAENDNQKEPTPWVNWMMFAIELAMLAGGTAITARRTAKRAFNSQHHQWLTRETQRFPLGTYKGFVTAIETGDIGEFCASVQLVPAGIKTNFSIVTLEYLQHQNVSPLEQPIYITIEESADRNSGQWPGSSPPSFLHQMRLTGAEIFELAAHFPKLSTLVQRYHQELAEQLTPHSPVSIESLDRPARVATISSIDPRDRCEVFSRHHRVWANVYGALPVFFFLLGCLGCYLFWSVFNQNLVVQVVGGSISISSIIVSVYVVLSCPAALESTYQTRVLRNAIMGRPGALVRPREQHSFVAVLTTRSRWQQGGGEPATDAGFAKIDHRSQALLIEGDNERFFIPFDAIASNEVECFRHPLLTSMEFWMVCLVIATGSGFRELIMFDGTVKWSRNTNQTRKTRAIELAEELIEAQGTIRS